MKDAGVAARYARALFIVTEQRGETVRALDDMKGLWTARKCIRTPPRSNRKF